jgi:hypothetical protein
MSKILYSAVVLDEKSHNLVTSLIPTIIARDQLKDWKTYAHHMTINLGELPEDKKPLIGKQHRLYVTHIDWNHKVCAVKVRDDSNLSTNKTPHITLATNVVNGGKPVMSNELINWKPLKRKFYVFGKIEEVKG